MVAPFLRLLNRPGCLTLALMLPALAAGSRLSADTPILTCVPENAAGCILFPSAAYADQRLTEFVRVARPTFEGFDLAELEMTAGFLPGTIDLTKPVIFIAERPVELSRLFSGLGATTDDPDWPAIGFTPRDPARFQSMIEAAGPLRAQDGLRAVAGAYGTFRLLMRGERAFVSPRRGPLEAIRRASAESSAWSQLSESARADAMSSDVFVHLSMDRWRDRLRPTVLAMTQLVKFGAMMQQKDPARFEETRRLADWFFDGVISGFDQMRTVSVGFKYDGKRFELSHFHGFAAGGWMANYLRDVRRGPGFEPWQAFPDQPFLLAGAIDWRVPAENCLAVELNRRCMEDPKLCRTLSRDDRTKLDAMLREMADATHSEEFIATGDDGKLHPIRVYGTFSAKHAQQSLDLQRRVREKMGDAMAGLFPGMSDIGTRGALRHIEGRRVYEARLTDDQMNKAMRDNIASMYGADAVYQEAVANERTIVYSLDDPQGGVRRLIPVVLQDQPALASNRAVVNAMALMPEDANVYVLIDVGRVAMSTPVLIAQGAGANAAAGDEGVEIPNQVGPLLTWSAQVESGGVVGRFAMDKRDVHQAVRAILKVGRRMSGLDSEAGAAAAAVAE